MSRQYKPLTREQIDKAQGFLRLGMSWNILPSLVGASYYSIRCHFDRKYQAHRMEVVQRCRERRRGIEIGKLKPGPKIVELPPLTHRPHSVVPVDRPDVPERVWAEREHAFSGDYSEFSALMGDPRPGRSALDKRRLHIVR